MQALERPGWRRWLKIIVFELCILAVLALLFEVGVRIIRPQVLTHDAPDLWQPDEAIGWRHRTNARVNINTGDRDVDICIDQEGDRVSSLTGSSSPCPQKVLVTGDSYTEAVAIPFEQTVWHLLERDSGACYEVAGVGEYKLSQYRKLVHDRLSAQGASIDLVVLNLYVGNDFTETADEIPPPTEVQRRPLRLFPTGLRVGHLRDWFYPYNQWLESRSHAYVGLRATIRRIRSRGTNVEIWGFPNVLRPSWLTDEVLEPSLSQVRAVTERAREAGVPVLVTLIPMRVQVLDPDGSETREAFPAYADDFDPDLSVKRIVPRLEEIPGVHLVDLLPGLRLKASREHWGNLDVHFSPGGHELWFELVRSEVRNLLENRGSSPGAGTGTGSDLMAEGGVAH